MGQKEGKCYIYKIVNDVEPNVVYIGSTRQPLDFRWYRHKCRMQSAYKNKLYQYMLEKGLEHFKIEVVKQYDQISYLEIPKAENDTIEEFKTNGYIMLNSIRAYSSPEEKKQKEKERKKAYYLATLTDPSKYKPREKETQKKKGLNVYQNRRALKVIDTANNVETIYKSCYEAGKHIHVNAGLLLYYIKNNKQHNQYKFELLDKNFNLDDISKKWLAVIRSSAVLNGFSKKNDPLKYLEECKRIITTHRNIPEEIKQKLLNHLN